MPGSTSSEKQLSAVRTRQLSVSKLSAQAQNINCYESKRHCCFEASSDTEYKNTLYTPSKRVQLPSPIHVHLPSAFCDSDDGDDELDDNSSSLDAGALEDINENVKKAGYGVKDVQAVGSDSSEDFCKNGNTSNISHQRNIHRRHIKKIYNGTNNTRVKENQNQNKIYRLRTSEIPHYVDGSETERKFTLISGEPKFTSLSVEKKFTSILGEQLYDCGTSDDVSDNYLGQVETTTNNIMRVGVPGNSDLHWKSFSNDNLSEATPLVTTHSAEPSDRKNYGRNGKLLSESFLKTKNNLEDSSPEVQYPDYFVAADDVNIQGEKVESDTATEPYCAEGTDHAAGFFKAHEHQRNIADSESNMRLHLYSSVKVNNSMTATAERIPKKKQRNLQGKNSLSNKTNIQTKLGKEDSELESTSEHRDFPCESVVVVGSSHKKYGNNTSNKDADSYVLVKLHSKSGYRSVPVVTVDYEPDESIKECKPYSLRNKANNMDVNTSFLPEQNIHPCSMPAVYKSSRERNYYEVARGTAPGAELRECVDLSEENSEQQDWNKLFKTTKTIEFMHRSPKEVSSKSIILPMKQPQLMPIDDPDYRQQTSLLQEYEPERIKKPRKKISSAPKVRNKLFFKRSEATSLPDPFRSGSVVWTQNKTSKPYKNNRKITANERPSSAITDSYGTRINSAPSRSQSKEQTVAEEIQVIQSKMASLGADDGIGALEKALFSTSGKMVNSYTANYLPSDPSYGLIPHYKHWLSEEYMLLKKIKKKLDKDDHYKHLRSLRTAKKMKNLTIGDVEKIIRKM